MGSIERVRDLALPVCEADGVELVDLELNGGVLRLTVDRDGGLDLDAIAGLTRRISRLLDDEALTALKADAVSVRCLQDPEGDVATSDDDPESIATVARAY